MSDSKKYPLEISERIKRTLRKEQEGSLTDTELDTQVKSMKKAVMMDKYLTSYGKKIRSSEICYVVKSIFDFDLDVIPVLSKGPSPSREVIDTYLEQCDKEVTGAEIRAMINEIFGVNLDAISALEGSRISLYSKEQWVVQHEQDLFVVHTGVGDIDAKVYPTKYFMEQTGLEELPNELKQSLISIGYHYDEEIRHYYFANPTGEPVPDSFKGKTMGAIMEVIRNMYSAL